MISLHGTVVAGDFSRRFDLEIGNEIVGIVGQNGVGKTSLLRTIAGLAVIGSGELSLNSVSVDHPAKRIFVQPELRNIGMAFQDHSLFPFMTAIDNAAFPLVVRGMKHGAARKLAYEEMEQYGVANVAEQLAPTLSGGQSQRVAIVRALIGSPQAVLLDEPLSAIDERSRNEVRSVIANKLSVLGVPTLIVSHDQSDIVGLCSRVERLNGE
jgi:molybdate transport system ATP-binding protein